MNPNETGPQVSKASATRGPERGTFSTARGGVETPRYPGVSPVPERRIPQKKEPHKGLTRRQKAWIWSTAITSAAAAGLGVGYKEGIFDRTGDENPPVTTGIVDTTIPTSPNTSEGGGIISPTTITEAPTTTTVQETTTTIPEVTWESLINEDITMEDVKEAEIIMLTPEEPNVPEKLQKEFEDTHYGRQIFYIGPNNRAEDPNSLQGNELNDCLVGIGGPGPEQYFYFRGYGGGDPFRLSDGQISWNSASIELAEKPIVLIPNSKDFYLYDKVHNVYVRIVRDENSKYQQTMFTVFDLSKPDAFDWGRDYESLYSDQTSELFNNREKHYAGNLSEEVLKKIIIPRDTMLFMMQNVGIDKYAIDERGKPVAYTAGILRNEGADQKIALFE